MGKYRYAVELFSVRNELSKDLFGTLKAIKEMGYEGVEFAGNFQYTAEEVKKALDETGLVCCGWHTPWNYLQDDMIEDTIKYFKTVGNPNAVIPGLPHEMTDSRDKWLQNAEAFNKIAKKLGAEGIKLGYHNHSEEVQPYETGDCAFTVLFDNTDPSVFVQMDNGNLLSGNGPLSMLDLLRRYPNRYTTVHLKPYSFKDSFATMIGEDDVPWAEFMPLCKEIGGTDWYIVEYECIERYPELEGVDRCIKALKEMESKGTI